LHFAAKADRLKQAKAEAEKEIKAYKAQREEQYQKRIADVRAYILSFVALGGRVVVIAGCQ
jgi:hypothetical protein